MREIIFKIAENQKIAHDVYRMILNGDTSDIKKAGQFVNIKLPDRFLRRPISVCDWNDKELIIIYKIVGSGTQDMSRMSEGDNLSILSGLGNGYDISEAKEKTLIIGGGIGVPPLFALAKKLLEVGVNPKVILGFNTFKECFYEDEFKQLGLHVKITTLDGSYGFKGLVTDLIDNDKNYYAYVCGSIPMLKAVHKKVSDGQFSFESRMGCGFGVCMGCSIRTTQGYKRICKDGTIFRHSEILWE